MRTTIAAALTLAMCTVPAIASSFLNHRSGSGIGQSQQQSTGNNGSAGSPGSVLDQGVLNNCILRAAVPGSNYANNRATACARSRAIESTSVRLASAQQS
jgi:hypothetical protein